jgi:hypothetical protein
MPKIKFPDRYPLGLKGLTQEDDLLLSELYRFSSSDMVTSVVVPNTVLIRLIERYLILGLVCDISLFDRMSEVLEKE